MSNIPQLLTLALAAVWLTGCADNTVVSEGGRVGVVTKLSRKALCDTKHWGWEGELSTSGGTTAAGQGATSDGQAQVGAWAFSIPHNADESGNVEKLQAAMNNGHHMKLSYRQVAVHDDCESGTDYLIAGVQDLEGK